MTAPSLKIELDTNQILKPGATRQDVAFFVTPEGMEGVGTQNLAVEAAAIILDISASMRGDKLTAAVKGGIVAVNAMSHSPKPFIVFGYVFGTDKRRIFGPFLSTDDAAVEAAKRSLNGVLRGELEGSTHTAGVLQLFRQDVVALPRLMPQAPKVTSGFAMLLTDGDYQDERDVRGELEHYKNLAKQGISLKIHARGVGVDWEVEKLRLITAATLSPPPKVLEDPSAISADFQSIVLENSQFRLSGVKLVVQRFNMGKILEVGVSGGAAGNQDLSARHIVVNEKVIEFPYEFDDTETRLFYLACEVNQPGNAPAVMCCKIWFEYQIGGQIVRTEPLSVIAKWAVTPAEQTLSQRVARGVRLAKGGQESERRMREASQLAQQGNTKDALAILAELVRQAQEDSDEGLLTALQVFVTIAADGTVSLKGTDRATMMRLDAASSVRRVRAPSAIGVAPTGAGADGKQS
jgi:hypothetical protein